MQICYMIGGICVILTMSHVFLQAIRQPNNFAGCSVYRLKILSRYVLIWIKMDHNVSMRAQHYKLCSKHCFFMSGILLWFDIPCSERIKMFYSTEVPNKYMYTYHRDWFWCGSHIRLLKNIFFGISAWYNLLCLW